MSKLEKNVGADLLLRTTRKVALSTAGAEFLPYARDIIAREDAARAALGQRQASLIGTLRFTAPSTFAQNYIMPILPRFMAQHPDLTLDLHLSDRQLGLIEGSFDLALRNAPLVDSSLQGRKLAADTRVLCAAPDYLARFGTPRSPQDLDQHQLIAFATTNAQRLVDEAGSEATFAPDAALCRLIIDDGQSHKLVTLAGAGISANSLWSVHAELRSVALVRVLPEWRLAEDSVLWLLYPKANVLSAKVRLFMDFLLQEIGKAPPWHIGDVAN